MVFLNEANGVKGLIWSARLKQTCAAQKRPEARVRISSKDTICGTLIHSVTLTSISLSLYLSALALPASLLLSQQLGVDD